MNLENSFKEVWYNHKKKIVIFLIFIITIIIVGYIFIFDYYKDVHKNNYIVVTCNDLDLGEYEETYKSYIDFENSKTVCGQTKVDNPLFPNININISLE